MHFVEKPGTSVEAMHRITVQASKDLRAIPGVRNFGSHIGRAEVADEVVGPNFTELWISIDPDVDYAGDASKQIEDVVDGYPGLYRDVLTYLRERIKEVLTGAERDASSCGSTAPTCDVLRAKAKEVETAMADVPGVDQPEGRAAGAGAADRGPAAARGGRALRPDRRATSAAPSTTLLKGTKVGEVYRGAEEVRRGRVGRAGRARPTCTALRALPIDTPAGRAGAARRRGRRARSCRRPTRSSARTASRRLDVTCNVAGPRPRLASPARSRRRCGELPFDREYHPEFLGEYAGPAGVDAAAATRWRRWRWSASCCCCTSTSSRGGRRCSSR